MWEQPVATWLPTPPYANLGPVRHACLALRVLLYMQCYCAHLGEAREGGSQSLDCNEIVETAVVRRAFTESTHSNGLQQDVDADRK